MSGPSFPLRRLFHASARSLEEASASAAAKPLPAFSRRNDTSGSRPPRGGPGGPGSTATRAAGGAPDALSRTTGTADPAYLENLDRTRSMLAFRGQADAEARALQAIDEGRKKFSKGDLIHPHHMTRDSLYPEKKLAARPPLLGPPKRLAKQLDPFYITKTNPLDYVLNPHFSGAFTNQMGRIKPRAQTGLTWKSQRLVGKMVRRARAMGVISPWSNKPTPGGFGYIDTDTRFLR